MYEIYIVIYYRDLLLLPIAQLLDCIVSSAVSCLLEMDL